MSLRHRCVTDRHIVTGMWLVQQSLSLKSPACAYLKCRLSKCAPIITKVTQETTIGECTNKVKKNYAA